MSHGEDWIYWNGQYGTCDPERSLKRVSRRRDDLSAQRLLKQRLKVHAETGVEYTDNNAECANRCKYLVLAVKPQFYEEVLKEIRYMVTPEHVLISLAPGKTIDQLKTEPWQ